MTRPALKLDSAVSILPAGGFAVAEAAGRIHGAEILAIEDVTEDETFRSLRSELSDIEELADRIRERGQLVPVIVWLRRGRYVLLSGHRRVAALRLAGSRNVKAIVYSDRELTEGDALDIAIADNIDRNNFSKLELARLVTRLAGQGMAQRAIARRLRISAGYVSYYRRLLELPEDVQRAVAADSLSVPAALRLEGRTLDEIAHVLRWAAVEGPLGVRDVDQLLGSMSHATSATDEPQPAGVQGSPSSAPAPRVTSAARRGAAWSREACIHRGVVWVRSRGDDKQFRITIPAEPTGEQREALRMFLTAQLAAL